MKPIHVLILNCQLDHRTGTETYTYDLACKLSALGHTPMVYSPTLGQIASEMHDKGIEVVDDLDMLSNVPDIIQSHHYVETFLASLYFPAAAVIYVCHDRLIWHSDPPISSHISRYVAVDYNCLDRLLENSISRDKTQVIYNTVDLDKFKQRKEPLPAKPKRALILSNQACNDNYVDPIKAACSNAEISLDVIGEAAGTLCDKPEDILGEYDIVFAKARCAMEAMACGASVVPCDIRGCGEIVTMDNIEAYRRLNFGMKILTNQITLEFITKQIQAYDPDQANQVSEWMRNNASLDDLAKEYINLYEELIKENKNNDNLQTTQRQLYKDLCRDLKVNAFDAKYRLPTEFNNLNVEFNNLNAEFNDLNAVFNNLNAEFNNLLEVNKELSGREMVKLLIEKIGRKLWK